MDELFLLVPMMLKDPSSWLSASIQSWKHPITFEWAILAGIYDMTATVNTQKGRKPNLWPKPWPQNNEQKKGKARSDARAILQKAKDGNLEWQNKPTPM
jgi:hypothetical protein